MLAFFTCDAHGQADRLLAALAGRLEGEGVRLAGAVQENAERDGAPCDMDLRILGSGALVRISERLGPGATACRLDPDGLERAVALAGSGLAGAELLIVNKFGKHEAEGRGFRELIGRALAGGVPVLTAVAGGNRPAFAAFTEGAAEEIAAEPDALYAWCRRRIAPRA